MKIKNVIKCLGATAKADIQPQTEQTSVPFTWMQEYWNSLKLGLKFAAGLLLMAGLWMVRKKEMKQRAAAGKSFHMMTKHLL